MTLKVCWASKCNSDRNLLPIMEVQRLLQRGLREGE